MNASEYNIRLKNTGRNDPCPCGSGKKYKKCHFDEDEQAQHLEMARAAKEREEVLAADETAEDDSEKPAQDANAKPDFHAHRGKTASIQNRPGNLPRRGAV